MALLGAVFNLGVYYPLRHRSAFLPVIIATIGASILMANSVLAIYGPQPQVLPKAGSKLRASSSGRFISTASIC